MAFAQYPQLKAALAERSRSLAVREGRLAQIHEDLRALRAALANEQVEYAVLTQVMNVFAELETVWHRGFEERLATIITRGLTYVFGEKLEFRLEQGKRGDLSSLDFKLVQFIDGEELVTDIMGAKGGGIVAVAAFLLRVLLLLAYRPALRPILFLDETFAHLSSEYVPNLAALLRKLNDETGLQFVMVTHDSTFVDHADVAYETRLKHGASQFSLLRSVREQVHG